MQTMQETICWEMRKTIMKQIQDKVLSDDIGKHFNSDGHDGKSDVELFVLDFVYCHPNDDYAKSLRF